jgi:hypothetical protein
MMILANGLAGLWCLAAHRWPSLRTRALWWFTVFAELTVFVQVMLGVGAMQAEDLKPKQFHMFYGFVAIITIAILYSYRAQLRHRLFLLYGFGGLFIMGLGIRAVLVGAA